MKRLITVVAAAGALALLAGCDEHSTPVNDNQVVIQDDDGAWSQEQAYKACQQRGQVVRDVRDLGMDNEVALVTCTRLP